MFIGYQDTLIALVANTKEELENSGIEFTSIEETDKVYTLYNGKYLLEEEIAQQEAERIAKLHLTKREVFLGLHKAKQVTPDQIRSQITDPEALIEFDYATEYYRGNPLIDMVGGALGITQTQLDRFFETNDYKELETVEAEPTEVANNEK